jgi:hypothetical protein
MGIKEGIILYERHPVSQGSKYEYRNKIHEYKFKCTLCNKRWRRFSQVYMAEHIKNHIDKGDILEKDVYED